MYPKKKIDKLIEKYSETFKKSLNIKTKIVYHILSSKTKKCKALIPGRLTEYRGLTFINKLGAAEIIIFYDQHFTERDVIGTILHELLHVRIHKLSGLVSLHTDKAHVEEEKIIKVLEEFFLKSFYDGKL